MHHRFCTIAIASLSIVLAMSASVFAVEAAPEIDPASMSGAVALLAAAGVFVADRVRRSLKAR